MSETLDRVRELVARGEVVSSVHGFRELAADGILLDDVRSGVRTAIVVEEYPDAVKGPSVLVLQRDRDGKTLAHSLGHSEGGDGPATIITAYRPKASRWSSDFMRRR